MIRKFLRQKRLKPKEFELGTTLSKPIWSINSQLLNIITPAKCDLIIMEFNWNQCFRSKKTKSSICRHLLKLTHNCKTGDFMSRKKREGLWNVQNWIMQVQSVQNYCFSLSNVQICDVFVCRHRHALKIPIGQMVTILQLLLFDCMLSCWQITLKVDR